MSSEPELIARRTGRAGVITLNRPKALNALTLGMVHGIMDALRTWAEDPEVAHVIIRQSGEKAFCAGGDIRAQHDAGKAGEFERAIGFYRDEYRMNRMIKRYPKPFIALIDGIMMGGGAGVSVHGTYQVGTEKLLFAMPEVGIGFFPDVGGTYFLPRIPHRVGLYLALTGERIGIADALWSGIVTHHVPASDLPRLADDLANTPDVLHVLDSHAQAPGRSSLADKAADIERLFSGERLTDILSALRSAAADGDAFAKETEEKIRSRSPTSVAVTFQALKRGGELEFEDCMRQEFRIASRMVHGHDFYEGVRAVILDKDNSPHWMPPTLEEVSGEEIDKHFEPIPGQDLHFPQGGYDSRSA
jgi:enoyl-CoA hydratase